MRNCYFSCYYENALGIIIRKSNSCNIDMCVGQTIFEINTHVKAGDEIFI